MKKKIILCLSILILIIGIIGIILLMLPNGDFEYSVNEDGTLTIDSYVGADINVIIPEEIKGKTVKIIGDYCFYNCKNIITINIPDTVEIIDDGAMASCESLRVVYGGENVKEIRERAFLLCGELEEISLYMGLNTIGDFAFDGTAIRQIEFPDSLKHIGYCAFANCNNLKNVEIPSSVESIGNGAFDTIFDKAQMIVDYNPSDFVIVGQGILLNYPDDKSVVMIPEDVKDIADCYHENSLLKELYVSRNAFRMAEYIIHTDNDVMVYIPSSVTEIGDTSSCGTTDIAEDMSKITLVVEAGSYAEEYAKQKAEEYGTKYQVVDKIEYPNE